MVLDNFNKKNGEHLSLPSSLPDFNNIPNTLPDLNLNYNNAQLPFFEVADNSYEEPETLPVLEPFSLDDAHKKGPIFIRTDEYKKVLDCVDNMVAYVKEGPDIVMMLKNLKNNQDLEYNKYLNNLEDIQRKLIYIDNLLFEAMKE